MKWQAVHFFKPAHGLSRHEPVEMAACLDYEQALESKRLVDLVVSLPSEEKHWMLSRALGSPTQREQREEELRRQLGLQPPKRSSGLRSRFVNLRVSDYEPPASIKVERGSLPLGKFQSWEEAARFPPIPAVCVAAPWFPKHWLEAPLKDRRAVANQLRVLYPIDRFAVVPFPLDAEESSLWIETVKADRNTRLYVIAVDHSEPPSAVMHKLARWLKDQKVDVSVEDRRARSRKGKVNVPACLGDLACYRLSSLHSLKREKTMDDTGFRRSAARLSTAKRRAEKRLRALNYI
jgi:hypothetical protein